MQPKKHPLRRWWALAVTLLAVNIGVAQVSCPPPSTQCPGSSCVSRAWLPKEYACSNANFFLDVCQWTSHTFASEDEMRMRYNTDLNNAFCDNTFELPGGWTTTECAVDHKRQDRIIGNRCSNDPTSGAYCFSGHLKLDNGTRCDLMTSWSTVFLWSNFQLTECPAGTEPYGDKCRVVMQPCQGPCNGGNGGPGGGGTAKGNPINAVTGNKFLTETDWVDRSPLGMLTLSRTYNSMSSPDRNADNGPLGTGWRHGFDYRLIDSTAGGVGTAFLYRPSGQIIFAELSNGTFTVDADEGLRVFKYTPAVFGVAYRVIDREDNVEEYDIEGRILTFTRLDARKLTFMRDSYGRLGTVVDDTGRSLRFSYTATPPYAVTQVTMPDDTHIDYTVSDAKLSLVRYPDQSARQYDYYPLSNGQLLLKTVSHDGVPYTSYEYNHVMSFGTSMLNLATLTRLNGANAAHQLSYNITPVSGQQPGAITTTVQTPTGATQTYKGTIKPSGKVLMTSFQRCADCADWATMTFSYDANGMKDVVKDYRGWKTDYDWNLGNRGLETQRTEAVNDTGASSASRRIQTDWSPSFSVPVERRIFNAAGALEGKKQWAYNSRGQPLAVCAFDVTDSAAMSYTCSAYDTSPPGVRRFRYTYCEKPDVTARACPLVGLLKSVDGPRDPSEAGMAGKDDVTKYTYRMSLNLSGCGTPAGPCYRTGDNWKVTNALGQVREYISFDLAGRVTRMRQPNGNFVDFEYNTRGWPTRHVVRANGDGTSSPDDVATAYEYNGNGDVTRIIQPDSTYLRYVYDSAHRLTDVVDNQGNRVHYDLDVSGNRRQQTVYDPNYDPAHPAVGIKFALKRDFDQLDNLYRILNANGQSMKDSTPFTDSLRRNGYDSNGNLLDFVDGNSVQTQRDFDSLNRAVRVTQDFNGSDQAEKRFTYDTRNNVTKVTDPGTPEHPQGLETRYGYDGLNRLRTLDSPDTGHTSFAYDAAGNRVSRTDARSTNSAWAYDSLNRLTSITYPQEGLVVSYNYDKPDSVTGCTGSASIGRLTGLTDRSGSTMYCYDVRGNIVSKKSSVGASLMVRYAYDGSNHVQKITYPSGGIATYQRDTLGRIRGLTWQATAASTPVVVVSDATYNPFGPLSKIVFGDGRSLTKAYDANYDIDKVISTHSAGLTLDYSTDIQGNINAVADTDGGAPVRRYTYDHLSRLTAMRTGANVDLQRYTYDDTGDRLTATAGGQTQTYAYAPGSHRLASVGGVARSYDANGNLTDAGAHVMYGYDVQNRLTDVTRVVDGGGGGAEQVAHASTAISLPSGNQAHMYEYNALGQRVAKRSLSNPLESRLFVYDEKGRLLGEYTESQSRVRREHLYIDGLPVASIDDTGALIYLETDHLGTPRSAFAASNSALVWRWDYLQSTFGENSAAAYANAGTGFNLRFSGQYFDEESALHYNYFRNYEPGTGRYLESDPIGLNAGPSTYGYALSRPLNEKDPYGLKTVCQHSYKYSEAHYGDLVVKFGYDGRECHWEPDPPPPACPYCDRKTCFYRCWDDYSVPPPTDFIAGAGGVAGSIAEAAAHSGALAGGGGAAITIGGTACAMGGWFVGVYETAIGTRCWLECKVTGDYTGS